jgi:glutaredoxin
VSVRPGAVLYTRAGCPPCFALGRLAARSSRRHGVSVTEVEIDTDPDLAERYGGRVPVLELPGGGSISGRAGAAEVDEAFRRAAAFLKGLEPTPSAMRQVLSRRGVVWIRRALGLERGGRGGRTA